MKPDPAVVAIGGGTGMSALLRGLKRITDAVTAIVTVADDGGHSGRLRDELGILPPGDFRNCLAALSDVEPLMRELFQYRFKDGSLRDQSFGNLMIAAMSDLSGGFLEGIRATQDILRVRGRVLPVSMDSLTLWGETDTGKVFHGEHLVGLTQANSHGDRIRRVYLDPPDCAAYPDALEAIRLADLILLGPGSLYTSLLPNLLVPGVADAVRGAKALRIYMCNLMTQPGETEGYELVHFLRAIREHCGEDMIDTVVVNRDFNLPPEMLERYRAENAVPVAYDREELEASGLRVVEADLLEVAHGITRHNRYAVARTIREIWENL